MITYFRPAPKLYRQHQVTAPHNAHCRCERTRHRCFRSGALRPPPSILNRPPRPPTLDRSSDASIVYHHSRERPANPVLSRNGDIQQPNGERHRCATTAAGAAGAAAVFRPATNMAAASDTAAAAARRGRSRRRQVISAPERFSAHNLCHVYGWYHIQKERKKSRRGGQPLLGNFFPSWNACVARE